MKMKKRFLSVLLSLVMVLGMVPGMSLTALAEGTTITWDTILSSYGIYAGMGPDGIYNRGTNSDKGISGSRRAKRGVLSTPLYNARSTSF